MADKRYLAIETSSPRLSLAIGNKASVLDSLVGSQDWRHAEILFSSAKKLLGRARWPVQSLSGVAVSIGPGSFTGIRVGLAMARALGQSLKIPVIGISSLEILAAGAPSRYEWLAPQIDALRQQVFVALYRRVDSGPLQRVIREGMVEHSEWPALVRKRAKTNAVWIPKVAGVFPDAKDLLTLAMPRFSKAGIRSFEHALPLYIREAAAVERRK